MWILRRRYLKNAPTVPQHCRCIALPESESDRTGVYHITDMVLMSCGMALMSCIIIETRHLYKDRKYFGYLPISVVCLNTQSASR